MREIKFRVKTKEGILKYYTIGDFACTNIEEGVEFDPETWSQFTGMQDTNGVDIYEGDIVEHTLPNEHYQRTPEKYIGVITYIDVSYSFRTCNDWVGDLPIHEDVVIKVLEDTSETSELLRRSQSGKY